MKKGKKYVEASKKVDSKKVYAITEAVKLVKETSITKFDSTVEVAFKLNLDTKKADQQLRGSLVLPNGTGKTKKVLVVATPDMMPILAKAGRILGPKGLMPNPKTGTVTTNVVKALEDIKKGMVEYKTDTYGNVHTIIGKVSFDDKKLLENLKYVYAAIMKSKPSS